MLTSNNQRMHAIRLGGGLDTSSVPMAIADGNVIGGNNYTELIAGGGYERVGGYERFDGRPAPSNAVVTVLGCDGNWSPLAIVGAIATGAISAATGVVCYWSEAQIALSKVTGTFQQGEQLLVGATPVGVIDLATSVGPLVSNVMLSSAADLYRADIGEVPGSGPVRGVCVIDDVVYAFRDNVGGTAQDVWKATSTGWQAIAYPAPYKVTFTNGSGTYLGGPLVITQGANTGTAHRVMVESGSFADGDAEGAIIFRAAPTPANMTAGAATFSGGTLTIGNPVAYTMFHDGYWNFRKYSFSELVSASWTGFVYGVSRYFAATDDLRGNNIIEFDGQCVVPLTAGGLDGPSAMECHKNHLFLAKRGEVYFSAIGDPHRFTVLSGAGTFVTGDNIVSMLSLQGDTDAAALLIVGRDRTMILYGNDSSDFNLVPLSRTAGASGFSAQSFGNDVLAMDRQGVRSFVASDKFGNFVFNTLTDHIRKHATNKTATASVVDSTGGHYRVFFDDGTWLSGTPGKRWSWMFCTYPFTVLNACEWEVDGLATVFVMGDTGYVYTADRGRSFDGASIEAWIKTAYSHFGRPDSRKAFRRCSAEIRGESAGSISVQADYSYGASEISAGAPAIVSNNPVPPPATPWDLGEWDNGTWDSQYASMLRVRSEGVGENVSLTFYSNTANELPHRLTTVLHYYLPRRMTRE